VRLRAASASLACVVAAVALAACGDDAKTTDSGEGADPSGTSTVATTPPAGVSTTVTGSVGRTVTTAPTATTGVPEGGVTTGETTSTGESGEGGAGDEEPARVPVTLTHRAGALSPTTVTVPAFLSLEVKVTGASTTATLPGGAKLTVPGTRTITGLKPGRYAITTADGGRTTLDVVNGGDPGP
jgi:hypothetical protein